MFSLMRLLIKCAHFRLCTLYDTKCDNFTHLLYTKINVSMIIKNI